MEPSAARALPVTLQESMLLQAGLDAYLREFAAHRELDAGATHPEEEWQEIQRTVERLQERLRELHRTRG